MSFRAKSRMLIVALIVGIGFLFVFPQLAEKPRLKVYQPADINPKLLDASAQIDSSRDHTVAEFELYNQDGDTIRIGDVDGKIYVADFFFTSCGNICPIMTNHMKELHDFYYHDEDIMFVSHTVYPEMDSVEVLKAYAENYGIDSDKWVLLTGPKQEIYSLARQSYFAVITEGDGGERDFIHTENFMLMDKSQRIRGYYDGTLANDMERLKYDIDILRREYR